MDLDECRKAKHWLVPIIRVPLEIDGTRLIVRGRHCRTCNWRYIYDVPVQVELELVETMFIGAFG